MRACRFLRVRAGPAGHWGVNDEWRLLSRSSIVGSGPAGLSAAARAAQLGLSHVLLEKTDHLSDTIYKYQKGKHVMATPSQLVLRSDMDFEAGKREAVLGTWDKQAAEHKVNVMLNAEVKAISGQKGDFTLALTNGEEIKAEYVILGIGTQGNPNKMRCEGGDLPHIQYQLDDPGEYVDEHITVIGSGDAGIENALGLAADPEQNNIVSILNRSAEFARAKQANVDLLMEAKELGRINVMCETLAGEGRCPAGSISRPATASRRSSATGSSPAWARRRRASSSRNAASSSPARTATPIRSFRRVRDDRPRHLRDRRAGRLSADQALHEPGL